MTEQTFAEIGLRAPEDILTLKKMGTSFPTRISFMRCLVRKIHNQKWQITRPVFDLDKDGFGHAVYQVDTGQNIYSLIVFSHDLPPDQRTDRVIAEAWDATFNLFDGIPTDEDIKRLSQNTPKQEAGRFTESELVLGRANRSLRMFDLVINKLKGGEQPDLAEVAAVGYPMRTTAVYGSGKFGCRDRSRLTDRTDMQSSFHLELLAVYLFRSFTQDLLDHIAAAQAPEKAVELDRNIKRFMGIGNSTGLGMAPFLLKHTKLVHRWVTQKEEALRLCRNRNVDPEIAKAQLEAILPQAREHLDQWDVADSQQMVDIRMLRLELRLFTKWFSIQQSFSETFWNDIYQFAAEKLNTEAVSFIESMIIECNGDLVDGLGEKMFEAPGYDFDPSMSVANLSAILDEYYSWIDDLDFDAPDMAAMYWYYSEEKLEPRFGDRAEVPGEELEMPLSIAKDMQKLKAAVSDVSNKNIMLAEFLLGNPEFRHLVKRVQTIAQYPYGEVRDNLINAATRPIDLLRFKLAFFGANKFDPKSSLWTRINMYQGAPLRDEILDVDPDRWAYPVMPAGLAGGSVS